VGRPIRRGESANGRSEPADPPRGESADAPREAADPPQ
jgi:hypothetical protein